MRIHTPNTKNMAIMFYISTPIIGDDFYNKYLKAFNFPRTRYPNADFYTDYHITIGYLKNVHFNDTEALTQDLTKDLTNKINFEQVFFEFGLLTLLGPPKRTFIAALPHNANDFYAYNRITFDSLKTFKNGKYTLDTYTLPERYLAHINLYGRIGREIPMEATEATMEALQRKLSGVAIPLSKIKIR